MVAWAKVVSSKKRLTILEENSKTGARSDMENRKRHQVRLFAVFSEGNTQTPHFLSHTHSHRDAQKSQG